MYKLLNVPLGAISKN